MLSKPNNCENMPRRYRPVVIVHGLMTGDVSTMQHLATNITKVNYTILNYNYISLSYDKCNINYL